MDGARMKKLLVFTDLDGTLLNHYNYAWDDAAPALEALNEKHFPVVFTSSKTASELVNLKQQMHNHHPFICENGAVANVPLHYFSSPVGQCETSDEFEPHYFGRSYQEIIDILNRLREIHGYHFRGFNDMELDDLVALTKLNREQALNAKQRQASEPFLWKDTNQAFDDFRKQLENENLIVTSGGRFFHVMSDVNKGKTVQWLIEQYQAVEPETQWISIGLGDSFNDVQMLEVVDYPVFISNAGTRQPDMAYISNLQRPQLPGPAGWNQAINSLMTKIL